MLRRVALLISVGLADSINPSTVGPALYLTTAHRRVVRVMQFTSGVFIVELAAGIVLTIGPGRLLLGLVPHPRDTVRHVIELVTGLVLLAVAVALWVGRRKPGTPRTSDPRRRWALGVPRGSLERSGRAADRGAVLCRHRRERPGPSGTDAKVSQTRQHRHRFTVDRGRDTHFDR